MNRIAGTLLLLIPLFFAFAPSRQAAAFPVGGTISIDPETGEGEEAGMEQPGIVDYSDRLIIRPYLLIPMNFLTISRYNTEKGFSSEEVAYLPNPSLCAGAGFSWWIFGFSFHTAVVPLRDTAVYGKTTFLDIQFNYYFRKIGFDLFYQRYKGFSLENSRSYGLFQGFPGAHRPDLSITAIGGNLFYIFSDGFSYNASFKQTERQTSSGGSFILMTSIINYTIDSSYSLIPPSQEIFYSTDTGFRGGSFTSFGLSPGYAHTFIIGENFYITPSLCVGSGLMKKSYRVLIGERNKYGSFIKVNCRLAAGYNADRWFYGVALVVDITSTKSSLGGVGISASNIGGFIETFAGYRI